VVKAPINPESALDTRRKNFLTEAEIESFLKAARKGRHGIRNFVGRPLERTMQVTGSYKDLSTLLSELEQSPEARRLLSPELFAALAGNSGQSTAESKESAPPQESEPNPRL
jgi:hypothetical protein